MIFAICFCKRGAARLPRKRGVCPSAAGAGMRSRIAFAFMSSTGNVLRAFFPSGTCGMGALGVMFRRRGLPFSAFGEA